MLPADPDRARWFAEQVQPHGPSLRAYLIGRYPALPDVDDVVQECFVRVLRVAEKMPVASPRALLFATARNLAIDLMRRRQVVFIEPNPIESYELDDGINVAESVSQQEELALLARAIASLPTRCRQVVTLRTACALSQREIAVRLGISENTVEKQLARGLRLCRDYFNRGGQP